MSRTVAGHTVAVPRYYRTGITIAFVVGVVWSAITLGFDGAVACCLWQQLRSQGFATTTGVITHSEVEKQEDGDGATYRPNIAYTYRVAGGECHGNAYDYNRIWSNDGSAQRIVADHPVGKHVVVYYNPADTSDAVLHIGLDGNDLLRIVFATPFNVVMLGFWVAAAGAIYRRLARPPAGGAKTWNDGGRVHVQLPKTNPLLAALVAVVGANVAGMLIFSFAIAPTVSLVLMLFGAILMAGAGVYLYQEGKLARGHFDLVIDDSAQTVSLPRILGRRTEAIVPMQCISSVELEQIEVKDSEGQISYRFAPVLVLSDGAGTTRCEKLAEWWDRTAAQDLAAWLREQLRLA
jgi:hypothetical protein